MSSTEKPFCDLKYYSPERMAQYYYQLQTVYKTNAQQVLEIGMGPGVVSHILKNAGIKILTCDTEAALQPDVCGDIRNLPLADNYVDLILCCQVLEHLPFTDLTQALKELKRVTKKHILISIPDASRVIYSLHKYPGGRRNSWVIHFPWLPVKGKMDKDHHWEQRRKGFSKKKIINEMKQAGLKIKKDFFPVDSPNNQFYLLEKS